MPRQGTTGSSNMLWSTQIALVDCACSPDAVEPSIPITARTPYPYAYEFSNGRCFADRRDLYENVRGAAPDTWPGHPKVVDP